jgi:hypothetical protein
MSLDGYLIASPQVRASRGASRGPTEQAERHGEREPRSKLSAVVSASLENRCPQRRAHSVTQCGVSVDRCDVYYVELKLPNAPCMLCDVYLEPIKAMRDTAELHSDRPDHMFLTDSSACPM